VANQSFETIPLDQSMFVNAGDSVKVECTDYTANSGTYFYDGSITATLINMPTGNGPNRPAPTTHHALPPHL
jgi:hypothetical protein